MSHGHHHGLSREQELRRFYAEVDRHYHPQPESEEETKQKNQEWWSNYFKGLGVFVAILVMFLGVIVAMTMKHAGGGPGEISTFGSSRR